jgi:hypothetical protein
MNYYVTNYNIIIKYIFCNKHIDAKKISNIIFFTEKFSF